MQDLDPASLLFIPRHEYAPLHVDPALFESVGEGAATNTFGTPNPSSSPPPTSSSTDPASLQQRLKVLAEQLDPTGHSDDETVPRKRRIFGMSATEDWDVAWEQGLDQRVQRIDGRNIFDSFLDGGSYTQLSTVQDMSLSPFTSDVSSQESLLAAAQEVDEKEETRTRSHTGAYTTWKQHSVFGSPSHPTGSSASTKHTADLAFELPPLPKRPRDILDNCYLIDDSAAAKSSSESDWGDKGRTGRIPKAESKTVKNDGQRSSRDTWRDAGKPLQQDTAIEGHGKVTAGSLVRPDKVQLTWEMNTRAGPKAQPEIPIISPYVTEAGTLVFEAVYQKHLDYAFKFRPTPAVIPYEFLVDCSFLLLAGTPSSIFTYSKEKMKFEMDRENVRIEGCSTASISNMLQDMMSIGTHMRRLVNVSETCIHQPIGSSLIRIAFGRSLSSYLVFLQGTVVALQETSRTTQMHILELFHRTQSLAIVLERLAYLCRCHVSQNMRERSVSRLGFYLPTGPDLLSMVYEEIQQEPVVTDLLWTALLFSMLDHASKPYMDIISRWLGITPSDHAGHDQTQLSATLNAHRHSQTSSLLSSSAINSSRIEYKNSNSSKFSIFDCHLQQSLRGLDPFGEFFVQSQHGWSWDDAEPIILANPLDYNAEFQISETIHPARFLDVGLVEQILDAGKELQILVEFEPRHPLIAHDRRMLGRTSNGLRWFYVHEDIIENKKLCAQSSSEVLQAVATRLEGMGWALKRRKENLQVQKHKGKEQATETLSADIGNTFEEKFSMELNTDFSGIRGGIEVAAPNAQHPHLDLDLDPNLQMFFSFSSTLGQTSDISLACPDMVAFLLGPSSSSSSSCVTSALGSTSPPTFPSVPSFLAPVAAIDHTQSAANGSPNPRVVLETLAPLEILAEQSLAQPIGARALLINTCVMSLYFHDLNLLGHLEIMERFMLMRDGQFVARIGEALFDEETGLLTRSAQTALSGGNSGTSPTPSASLTSSAILGSGVTGTGGRPSMSSDDRRYSGISVSSSGASLKGARLDWPPQGGVLEMALRAVLLDCFQSSSSSSSSKAQESFLEEDDVISDMEIEDSEVVRSQSSLRRSGLRQESTPTMRRMVDAQELEESLAFAVKEYDDDTKFSRDASALEALDFLYLDYKAPRPLRLLFFTPEAFEKYTRLFTFQLRLARVDAYLKHIYRRLRTRQKAMAVSNASQGLKVEMVLLHRYRFEAQQVFNGFQGYIAGVAMGVNWGMLMKRLGAVQARIEGQITSNSINSDEEDAEMEDDTDMGHELNNLAAMHDYHDHILDQMLLQSLLKRKQAPILKVVHGILNCILKLWQFVERLPETSESDDGDEGSDLQEQQQQQQDSRITKLRTMQDKFRSLCRMLVKVLKVLDERGLGSNSGGNDSGGSFLQQLLLRLDMSGFND